MIITDPSTSPSKRFLTAVAGYFTSKAYTCNKTYFERVFIDRTERVYPMFLNWGHLVTVTLHWSSSFVELEKLLLKMTASKRRKVDETMQVSLVNYEESRKRMAEDHFDLYDSNTHRYNDFSINRAADRFIKSYETFAEPFFSKYNSLSTVEKELNALPIKRSKYTAIEKHLMAGPVLCKMLQPDLFGTIHDAYETYLNDSKYADKEEYLLKLRATVDYLNTEKIMHTK